MQAETQIRLAVLRSLAAKNEEATQANVVNVVDNEAIEEVKFTQTDLHEVAYAAAVELFYSQSRSI